MARAESLNLLEFQKKFGTEEACERYLFERRWPDGFNARNVDMGNIITSAPESFMNARSVPIRHPLRQVL